MSMKPPKHSEMKWPSKRQSKKKFINLDYNLIVCEGTKTEPNYFMGLKEVISQKQDNRIQLEIIGTGENTRSLFETALELARNSPNGYSDVWIVFDKDDFPAESFNVMEELCNSNSSEDITFHAVWSNQCIELWFLLHFMYLQSDLHRSEYYPKLTKCLGKEGAYRKNREDIFPILLPYIDFAIANARKLDAVNKDRTPALSSPGTKVYEMMEKFRPYLE